MHTEDNKRNAKAFYDLMFNQCRPAEAVARYVGDEYIQHNPHVSDGKQAFIDSSHPAASTQRVRTSSNKAHHIRPVKAWL